MYVFYSMNYPIGRPSGGVSQQGWLGVPLSEGSKKKNSSNSEESRAGGQKRRTGLKPRKGREGDGRVKEQFIE